LLGLLLVIGAGTLGGQLQPGQYPGPKNDGIELLLEKLDKADQSGDLKQAETLCQEIIRERPASALGYIRLGLVYKREQDPQGALSAFQFATRVEPGSFNAQYDLGEAYLGAGQPEQAIHSLSQAVRLEPHSRQALRLLAQAFMEAGKTRDGLEQFLQSVEMDPTNPEAFYDLGQACLRHALGIADRMMGESKTSPYCRRIFAENYIGHGSFGEAEAQYQLALKAEPEALDLRLSLGELYLRENKPEEARREIAQAVKLAPTSLVAHYDLAETHFLRRDLVLALVSLRRVASLNPGFLASNPSFLEFITARLPWQEECSRVADLASSGHPDSGLLFLKEACHRALDRKQVLEPLAPRGPQDTGQLAATIARDSVAEGQDPAQLCLAGLCSDCEERLRTEFTKPEAGLRARLRLGQCAYDVENYAAAYHHFAAARELAPHSLAALYWEQEAARQLARTSFERVEQLAPDSYMIHVLNAQTWERQNQLRLATQEYKAAIARRSDAANLHVLLGHLYWYWERYDDALSELQEALRLDPVDAAANYLVGDSWVQEHEAKKALPYLDKALRLRPGFLNAEASLGRALSQLGKYQEAVSELLKVAPADADGSIHFQLFQLYQKLGEKDKAKEALESFKTIRAHRLPKSASGDTLGLPK
jgi:tetratricopeptide (TPR) repeat protein